MRRTSRISQHHRHTGQVPVDRLLTAWTIALALVVAAAPHRARAVDPAVAGEATAREASAARLFDAVRYLASDELEGRGVGTRGLDLAAEYIAAQFQDIGLRTDLFDTTPFQAFQIPGNILVGSAEDNQLIIRGPETNSAPNERVLELGTDFNPLAVGANGHANAPLVFVGYGITAKDWNYDDYDGVDVQGKVVIMLRKEPQQGDATSVFDGLRASTHASFLSKVNNAVAQGAAAVILVNDEFDLRQRAEQHRKAWQEAVEQLTAAVLDFRQQETPSPEAVEAIQAKLADLAEKVNASRAAYEANQDVLLGVDGAGTPTPTDAVPVFFCRRESIDPILQQALGTDLAELERQIDVGPTPRSQELVGWSAECRSRIVREQFDVKNVVGVLEGSGPLADETIVIGAHYDHIGMGGRGSLARGVHAVHNGADDNASGTSAVIELARRMASRDEPARRRLMFVAFTAEERGLLGGAHYVRNPLFPLENTVAMVNFDMIGRLTDNKLTIGGTGTAVEFDAMLDELNAIYQFDLTKTPSGIAPSDHSVFYRANVPVLFFFTGLHGDYHRPTDVTDKIDVEGMLRITDLATDVVERLLVADERPQFRQTPGGGRRARGEQPRPFLGVTRDVSSQTEGFTVLSVAPESPAEKGGILPADRLVRIGEHTINHADDVEGALSKHQPDAVVEVVVERHGQEISLSVTLARSR